MERRNHQEMENNNNIIINNNNNNNNPVRYTPPQQQLMIQESPSPPLKLPLAPILSTPPDNHRRPNAAFPTRRGSSIFSPAHHHHHHQTLDHHPYNPPPPPPPPPLNDAAAASPDPDPPTPPKSKSPPPPAGSTSSIRYRECLKNHAASMGAHVVDGCGEFMPSGEDGTADSLRCAACDCHRNFHRKEGDGDPTPPQSRRPPAGQAPSRHRFASPPGMVSFGAAAESSSGHAAGGAASSSKKRFRTKFRQDQKDRMHEFATKIGWRMLKEDADEVQRFCDEVGVKRQVLKVWMHNNKQAIKKRSEMNSTD